MKAPFPYFGGKSGAAAEVWARLGNVSHYIEPFCGSAAALLARPHWRDGGPRLIETVNDADGHLANFWRSMVVDPEAVAHHADWPVNECDLHARHLWLVGQRERVTERLMADPDWCDPKAAGWWVWGCCSWIGSGWCSGEGPWVAHDGELVHRDTLTTSGQGINRKLPHLNNAGRGINRKLPHLNNAGRAWGHLEAVAARLRDVRVACGDWSRVLGGACRPISGDTVGVFLDPPYGEGALDYSAGGNTCGTIAADVWSWAVEAGERRGLRIVVAGYEDGREVPPGWSVVGWTGPAGYQASAGNNEDRARERLWCSPGCVDGAGQLGLFGVEG